jgi:predicted DNA-binding transcriptional regulator YafY
MNRTDRLLAIVLELQAKGWQRAEDLATTFEVSKRSIYRDMLALLESGVPVISSPGKGYALDEAYFLPPLSFTADEALMLLLGADFVAQHFDVQYQRVAASSASKITAVLTDARRAELATLRERMRFVASHALDNPEQQEILGRIRRAILQNRTVRFDYHTRHTDDPAGIRATREADPYAIAHHDRAWYMLAYCHLRRGLRNFRLDRIDALDILPRTFTRPQDFELRESKSADDFPVTVRALFQPEAARWAREDRSFYEVSYEDTPDGLLLTLAVRHENDVLQWLLGWGAQVRVLEPESLARRLADEAEAILRNYQRSESLLP